MKISDFGTYTYRKFDYTFLNRVIVTFSFAEPENKNGIDERMKEFSSSQFGIQSPNAFFENGTRLNRSDGRISFSFTKQSASVDIDGEVYKSFGDTIIPLAYKLRVYVNDVVGANQLQSISIRKINLWQFEYDKNVLNFDTNKAREIIFSSSYNALKINTDIQADELIRDLRQSKWSDDNSWIKLRSGFVNSETDAKEKKSYGLFLDSEGFESPVDGIKTQEIDDELKTINTNLYNAYMWCISEKVRTIMEKGKED